MTLDQVNTSAPYVTYASAAGAVTVWGLHVSDIAVIVSSIAAVSGAVIQVMSYLERRSGSRGTETNAETDRDSAS